MRSFTEATAVRELVMVPPYAFAATNAGLDRWDLRSGNHIHLSAEHGLPDDHIIALHYDGKAQLWVVTDSGLARYDVDTARFEHVPKPPPSFRLTDLEGASVVADSTGGAWLGLASGLYRVSANGQWTKTEIDAAVTSLFRSAAGDLWIGTDKGLFTISPRLEHKLGPEQFCDFAKVRFIAAAPDGGPVIVGENAAGNQRVAFHVGEGCHTFRVAPDEPWLSAAKRGDELVVLTPNRLYSLSPQPKKATHRRLSRNGARLFRVLPERHGNPPLAPYVIHALNRQVPAGAQTIAAVGEEVLVGTRNLGTARVGTAGGRTQWLRRLELVDDASTLSVACAERDDCYVATGGSRVWRFNGERFIDIGDGDRQVLAVLEDPDGNLIALRHSRDDVRVKIARIEHGIFTDIPNLAIETPGQEPRLTFARFSPSGLLWIGVQYIDHENEVQPYGVAQVDIEMEVVAYHHDSAEQGVEDMGVLPIPIGVADAAFSGPKEVWLATSQGAARVVGHDVELFDETRGLRSEVLRGVAVAGGKVFIASSSGVAVFQPETKTWDYPRALRDDANDLEVSEDGRLWMATNRGLAVFDGERVRRLDARRGLIENEIQDVAIDRFGRIWIRGAQGIGLISP